MSQESPLETLSTLITRLFDEAQTAYQRGDRKIWRVLLDQGDKLDAWQHTPDPRPPFPDLDWDTLRARAWLSIEEDAILKRLASGILESEEPEGLSDEPDVSSNEENARTNNAEDPALETPTYPDPLVAANMKPIQVQVEQHDFIGALAELARLSETYPDEPAYREEWVLTQELQELARDRLLKQAREEADPAGALALYQQVIAIDPDSETLYQDEIHTLEEQSQAAPLAEENQRPDETLEDEGVMQVLPVDSYTETNPESPVENNVHAVPESQGQPEIHSDVENNLALIKDMAARKEFVSAIQSLEQLIEQFPTEPAYEAEKTLIKDQQQKARDAITKQAEQEKDPAKALLLYQKAIEYDPDGESLYQSDMQALRQSQQDTQLEEDIQGLKTEAEKRDLSLAQAKSLQERLRARLDDPSYKSRKTQLEEIEKFLKLRIIQLEEDNKQVGTLETLQEFDKAITTLEEFVHQGQTTYAETRNLPDGKKITIEVPISTKIRQLLTLRGGARLSAARKWAMRASEIMQDGFPERAISLLSDALGIEKGIGDVTEEYAPGISHEKEELEKTIARYQDLRDKRNEAHNLVLKAEAASTHEALGLLKQALTLFPNYPGGQMILVRREGEIINRVQSDVQKRLGQARRALTKYDPTGAHFDTALEEINTARSNIADLTITSLTLLRQQQQTLEQRIQTSEEPPPEKERELIELTDFIREREKLEGLRVELDQLEEKVIEHSQTFGQDARFHAEMEKKLARFKAALQKREMALVAQIFDTLTDKEKDHSLGSEIIILHDALLGDEQLLVQYEAAYERRDFQGVLDLDLQKFQQRTERPYLRALELRALASFYLRLREIQAMVRRSDFDETRDESTGQVIAPGAQAALEDLWQDINSLPVHDQKKAWEECDTLEKTIAQARITRKEEIERRNKISAHVREANNSMNQGDYPEAWRIFSNAGLPRDNPDIRKFEAELIQKWQRHLWLQVDQAEAGRIPDLTRLFNELQHFRTASLIEASQEPRARSLEQRYWTQKAQVAKVPGHYHEAKAAWEAVLKLTPNDSVARAGLAEIEHLLNEQQVTELCNVPKTDTPAQTAAKILAAWNTNPALKTNLDLINLLLEKRLEARQLKEIADEINALRFTLPGGGDELFDFWESLVEARQLAAQKRYADALESLDLLKAHSDEFVTGPGQDRKRWFLATGNGVYDIYRTEWLNHLANQAAQKERAGGDVMEILSAWGQVLRFVPNHVRAGQAVNHHKDILRTVRKDLDDKEKQLVIGSRPPAEVVTQAQTLVQEMESILQVLGTLKMDAERTQVKALQDKVRRRIKSIETMTEALTNAQNALRTALGKTFDMAEVRNFLNQAREANLDSNVKPEVLALFEAEFNQADGLLRKVNDTILNVQRSFTQENFQQVLDQLQILKDNLLEVNRMLDRLDPTHVEAVLSNQMLYVQDPFGIPEKGQGFTYYRRGNIEGEDAIRTEAVKRKNDLKRWSDWVEGAGPALSVCFDTTETFLNLLVNGPLKKRAWETSGRQPSTPALNNANDALIRLKSNLMGLGRARDDLPSDFLSAQAIRDAQAKMDESLRIHKRSPNFQDNPRLRRLGQDLSEEGLAGEPVQMRELLAQLLALTLEHLQDLGNTHGADLIDRLARIAPLEEEVNSHSSKFGRERPVADRIVAHVRTQLKQIKALDPAYIYPNEAVMRAAFPDGY